MIRKINKRQLLVISLSILIGMFVSLAFIIAVNIIFPQPKFYFGNSRFTAIALVVSSIICLFYYRTYFVKNLHKAFLLLALAFGVSFTLVFPRTVYLSPDDQIHFRNAYIFMNSTAELRGGFLAIESADFSNLENKGFDELSSLYETIDNQDSISNAEYHASAAPQLYLQIAYLPFHIGLKTSEFLHLNFTTGVIIAKLCNLLCYITLVYFAIRESGKMRKIFFVVGLLVSNIFLATQFSYDPIIIASLLLAISLFLHMYQSKTVEAKYLLGFILAVVLGSLTKAIYCPLILLLLLLPNDKFDSKKRAIVFKICATLVMIVLASTFVLPVLGGSVAGDIRGGNTSVSGQLQFLLSNPTKGAIAAMTFFLGSFPGDIMGDIMLLNLGAGASSGIIYRLCHPAASMVWVVSMIALLWATFSTNGGAIITKKSKISIAIICMILSGLIFTSMYLSFTSVGSIKVDGVQPRYFMPFLPLLLMLFVPLKPRCQEQSDNKIILFASLLSLTLIFGVYVLHLSML